MKTIQYFFFGFTFSTLQRKKNATESTTQDQVFGQHTELYLDNMKPHKLLINNQWEILHDNSWARKFLENYKGLL